MLPCEICKKPIPDSWPQTKTRSHTVCMDCSYLYGIISEEEYVRDACFFVGFKNVHADIINNEISIRVGKYSLKAIRDKDYRNTAFYRDWRLSVFTRDCFTCQHCLTKGGCLEAHHIKPYKTFKESRFDLNNGITLCKKCHKDKHTSKEIVLEMV